ncbi:MAG: hypothetical protein ACFE0J_04950 [Elainellaceae cyanobacterium]
MTVELYQEVAAVEAYLSQREQLAESVQQRLSEYSARFEFYPYPVTVSTEFIVACGVC